MELLRDKSTNIARKKLKKEGRLIFNEDLQSSFDKNLLSFDKS